MRLYYTNNCKKWFPGLPPFNLILPSPHHSTIIHTWLTSNDISFLISIHKLPLPYLPATSCYLHYFLCRPNHYRNTDSQDEDFWTNYAVKWPNEAWCIQYNYAFWYRKFKRTRRNAQNFKDNTYSNDRQAFLCPWQSGHISKMIFPKETME